MQGKARLLLASWCRCCLTVTAETKRGVCVRWPVLTWLGGSVWTGVTLGLQCPPEANHDNEFILVSFMNETNRYERGEEG